MADQNNNIKSKRPDIIAQCLVLLVVVGVPLVSFFFTMGSKIESMQTRQYEQFERLHDDLDTLEDRLARDEQTIISRLNEIDERLRHVEQLSARHQPQVE